MASSASVDPSLDAKRRLAVVAGCALLVAGLVLVAFVLPAEYGVDPFGTGARFGLLPLGVTGQQVAALEAAAARAGSAAGETAIIATQDRAFHDETVNFTLAAGEFIEYKYRLEKGTALLYAWTATAPVNYELHAEPDGAPRGYAQSYEKKPATSQAAGTLTAPFSGIHGWYWENPTSQSVTVTLKAAGFYTMSHEFHKDAPAITKTF